jgi:Mg2+/citrate symporter
MNGLLTFLIMVLIIVYVIFYIVGIIGCIINYPESKEKRKRVKEEEHFPFVVDDIIIEKKSDNKKSNF